MNIIAGQHFYASLRQDQSFGGSRGLQTLFYTHALITTDESRLIEDRAQFDPKAGPESKWQFYRLPTGKTVISYLAAIPEPDEFGRTGRYLCHSLVLSQAAWEEAEHSPFPFLQETLFCSNLEQAMERGTRRTWDCPPYEVEPDIDWPEWAKRNSSGWNREELENLAAASSNARLIAQENSFLALIGEDTNIVGTLGVAFLLTPPLGRAYCSFDTASSNCTWRPDVQFWARGFTSPTQVRTDLVAD